MKKIIFIFTCLLLSAFQKNDIVEVENLLNARSGMNFTGKVDNIRAVLKKGTLGIIKEFKKLPSGNFGVQLSIQSGDQKGKTYWVYYNKSKPSLKITSKEGVSISTPEVSSNAIAARDIASIRDPEEANLNQAVDTAIKATDKNLSQNLNAIRPDCILSSTEISDETKISYDLSKSVPPFHEINESSLQPNRCGSNSLGIDICQTNSGLINKFTLTNHGGNDIVKKSEYYINRVFEFSFEGQARSDMQLIMSDNPDEYTSHTMNSIMMFFPRSVLPSVKKVGEILEVTLPNTEIIKFNSNTKEIIGGVMTEQPMGQEKNGKAKPVGVTYTGKGVIIRADKNGDYPIGDGERSDGTKYPSTTIATVSKMGFKDCKIPSKDLWYTNYQKEGNVFIKPEYASDAGLDILLKKKCGFSIY